MVVARRDHIASLSIAVSSASFSATQLPFMDELCFDFSTTEAKQTLGVLRSVTSTSKLLRLLDTLVGCLYSNLHERPTLQMEVLQNLEIS